MPEKLEILSGAMGPTDKDVLAQLSTSHPLQISEAKVSKRQQHQSEPFWSKFYFSSLTTSSAWTAKWSETFTEPALKWDTWWKLMQSARSAACRSFHPATFRATFSWAWTTPSARPTSTAHQSSPRRCTSLMLSSRSDWESCKLLIWFWAEKVPRRFREGRNFFWIFDKFSVK